MSDLITINESGGETKLNIKLNNNNKERITQAIKKTLKITKRKNQKIKEYVIDGSGEVPELSIVSR